jgi:hypothetical protein
MEPVLTYRGRAIEPADVAFIRELIAARPKASRRRLSIELCRAWGWVQPNGALRDAVCRGLLLALHRGGHIELPAAKYDGFAAWRRREPTTVTIDTTPIESSLAKLGPVALRQVRRTDEEVLVNALVAQHHYIGYRQPVGEHLTRVSPFFRPSLGGSCARPTSTRTRPSGAGSSTACGATRPSESSVENRRRSCAARGIRTLMPRPRLCRVAVVLRRRG